MGTWILTRSAKYLCATSEKGSFTEGQGGALSGLTRKSSHKGENNITVLNISKMTRPGSETWI